MQTPGLASSGRFSDDVSVKQTGIHQAGVRAFYSVCHEANSNQNSRRKEGHIVKYMTCTLLLLVALAVTGLAQEQKPSTPAPAATLTAELQVCTGVTGRMPTGSAANFDTTVGTLYCWSKITGSRSETTVKHIWMHEGKEMLAVELPVKGDPWRTYSHKKILPQWTGNWEVKVVDAGGATLKSLSFTIGVSSK